MERELVFYGTGGAEGIPSPFCRCTLCEHARARGGKDRRRRSMLRVGTETLLDMGPDTVAAAMDWGDLYDIRQVLITHTHEDHFYYALAETRALSTARGPWPLDIHLTGPAYDVLQGYFGNRSVCGGKLQRFIDQGAVAFHRLEYGVPVKVGGMEVVPLPGNHTGNMGERPANYLLKFCDGRTMYYGVDTGYYLEETLAALRGRHIDILVSECTFGNAAGRGEKPDRHLDMASAENLFRQLVEAGVLDERSRVFLTHINHKHTGTHAVLEEMAGRMALPCSVAVAYDGMRVET